MLINQNLNHRSQIQVSREIFLPVISIVFFTISLTIFIFARKTRINRPTSVNKQTYGVSSQVSPTNVGIPSLFLTPTTIQSEPLAFAQIPTLMPTPILEDKPSYVYDPYYPIILSLSDSKGGITRRSGYNQYFQGSSITGVTLKVGDTIHWKAETSDPQNRQILYCFHSNSQRFTDLFGRENGQYKYITSNEIEFTITEDDIKEVGEAFSVVLYIKSEKDNYRTGSSGYDDVAYLDYKLSR